MEEEEEHQHKAQSPRPAPKREAPKKKEPAAEQKKSEGGARAKDVLYFNEEEACREAIAEVRSDASETQWVVFGAEKPTGGARMLGKGVELADMYALLTDTVVAWVLLRRSLLIDESETTKFVFINWIGERIPRMLRARLGTWSGVVQQFMEPYHVDINASTHDEVTEDVITSAIQSAAGVKDHVLA